MKITLKHIKLFFYTLLLLFSANLTAQLACENTKKQVTLSNGFKAYLFKEKASSRIYLLPTSLQLSENNGIPEFSYQEYTNRKSTSPDGAILHFLITWGPTKNQLRELALHAKKQYGEDALLVGALYLEADRSALKISNKTSIGKILNASLKSKGSPPTTMQGKMALSFHIRKENVKIMGEAIKRTTKLSGSTISINYNYKTYLCGQVNNGAKNNTIKLIGNMKQWF